MFIKRKVHPAVNRSTVIILSIDISKVKSILCFFHLKEMLSVDGNSC